MQPRRQILNHRLTELRSGRLERLRADLLPGLNSSLDYGSALALPTWQRERKI